MKVLLTDHDRPDLALERELFREAGIEMIEAQCRTEDDVIDASAGCSGLLVQYAQVGERVFAARPEIGIVSRQGAGYDTVDLGAAQRHGVWVSNSPDYGVGEVATHALALLLSLVRHVPGYDRAVREGRWHYTIAPPIRRASDLTVGILGLGRIGKRFAHLARNVFGRVIAHDPYLIDGDFPAYVERVSLDALFERADAVSIHCLLSDETEGMVDAALLSRMKPGSYLVNTARGAIVDVPDLTQVLASGRLAGVGLDVLPVEPVPPDHPLLADPRVVFTPHAAFYSTPAEAELRRKAATNIVTWARTGRPDYVVSAGTRKPPRFPV